MIIKTKELTDVELDYAVAVAVGLDYLIRNNQVYEKVGTNACEKPGCAVAHFELKPYAPSMDKNRSLELTKPPHG